MSDNLILTMQVEDPSRGTLEVTHMVDIDQLNCYNGPLGRIIIHDPALPDAQFVMPADEFMILLAQFIQQFRGIQ